MVDDRLAVGLIGAGPWARAVTGPVLAAGPQTSVTGIWSRTPAHAEAAATQLGVPAFTDLDALFDTCDAVAIAVAPGAQPALAEHAAAAGKSMLLEKPLAGDVAGARTVVDAIERAGVGAVVTLSYRFNPLLDDFIAALEGIEPVGGRGCFISGAFLGGPFATGWRLERGAVLDVGPHLLDLLEAALGPIVDVKAAGDPMGTVALACTHASGATSSGTLCCTAASDSRTEIEVYGRTGTRSYDGRKLDGDAWGDRLRDALVTVAGGGTHPANARRALHLQELIEQIEAQLS